MTKLCRRCGTEKPLTAFYRINRVTGERPPRGGMGVEATCKDCRAERHRPGVLAMRAEAARLHSIGFKTCGQCRVLKALSDFAVRKASRDGLGHSCRECNKQRNIAWRIQNPDGFRQWASLNTERRSASWRSWYEANKDHRTQSYAEWAKRNRDTVNALIAKRNAAKKRAVPKWADMGAIRAVYSEAARLTKETGVQHHVDHIYPLQSYVVCGLHCEANLQILTRTENIRKSNKLPSACIRGHYEAAAIERVDYAPPRASTALA